MISHITSTPLGDAKRAKSRLRTATLQGFWVLSSSLLAALGCLTKTGNTTNINKPPECGDRRVDDGEKCDDGNNTSGDGCSKDCRKIEQGYECPPEGGECQLNTCCNAGDGERIGCSDSFIEECVCDDDNQPLCCTEPWLAECANIAIKQCEANCVKKLSNCKEPSPFPSCSDPEVAARVCVGDNEVCCTQFWDEACVFAAYEMGGLE